MRPTGRNSIVRWPHPTSFAPLAGIRRPPSTCRCGASAVILVTLGWLSGGCATIRTTDPQHTATEQFLLSSAAQSAVDQVSADTLRDRIVFIDTAYLTTAWQTAPELSFLIGQFRAKLLEGGARLASKREEAQIIVEVRSGGVGIDRLEFLLGIPSIGLPQGVGSIAAAGTA